MQYVADTVAIVRHFSKSGKIGKTAKQILRKADRGEATIFIFIVSMVEILYLAERCKIPLNFETVKSQLLRKIVWSTNLFCFEVFSTF